MLFRFILVFNKAAAAIVAAIVVLLLVGALFNGNAVLDQILHLLFYAIFAAGAIGGLLGIYCTIRGFRAACPICGNTGDLDWSVKGKLLLRCRACGIVGGSIVRDWSIKVYPPGNPTRDWVRNEHLPLEVDLDAATFCGVPLGDPVTPLQGLGQVEDAADLVDGDHTYYALGVEYIAEEDGTLGGFTVHGGATDDERFAPFAGQIRIGGHVVPAAELDALRFVQWFGEPTDRDHNDEEICLYYERPGIAVDAEFSPDGKLCMLFAHAG